MTAWWDTKNKKATVFLQFPSPLSFIPSFQFKPLEQLMGVFPAASGKFLPPTWRELMSDPVSPP